MTSGNASSSQLTPKSSRFSTSLKVFGFSSKDKETKPPPLPPKDAYYLRNRSLASLSPDSLSTPSTPVSPGFLQPRSFFSDLNKSTMSLASTAPSGWSTSRTDNSHKVPKKEKSGFFRFPKRQKSQTKSPTSEDVPPLPTEDGSISMPWNFQHNIHVDEGYVGLPPSWVASLSQAGFSQEEISDLQHRRAAARSPTSQYANSISPPSDTSVLKNPTPRTTSLPRRFSKSSLSSSENHHASKPLPQRQLSVEQHNSMQSSSFLDTDPMDSRLTVIDIHVPQILPSQPDITPTSESSTHYHVNGHPSQPINGFASSLWKHSNADQPLAVTNLQHSASSRSTSETPEPTEESADIGISPSHKPSDSHQKRLTALPPRLSLTKHEDVSDLSSWSEALLSGISTTSDTTPNSLGFLVTQEPKLSPQSKDSATGPNLLKKQTYEQLESRTSQKKPVNPLLLNLEADEGPLESSWVEPASTARYDPEATSWDDDAFITTRPISEIPSPVSTGASPLFNNMRNVVNAISQELPMSAAVSETSSPTLPLSPERRKDFTGGLPNDQLEQNAEDDGLLMAGGARASNRDSSRSSTSTVIAEPATIVRSVSIIRRAAPVVLTSSPKTEQASSRRTPPAIYVQDASKHPPSPLSSHFGSEEGSTSGTGSSSPTSYEQQTPMTDGTLESPLTYYYDSTPSPDPAKFVFPPSPSSSDRSGRPRIRIPTDNMLDGEGDPTYMKPRVVINDVPSAGLPTPLPSGATPKTPFQRYPGWLSSVVAPLEDFIDEAVDPRNHYLDLQEIAEGESGSVFAARLSPDNRHKLKLAVPVKARDQSDLVNGSTTFVAVKSVAILPTGSPKLTDLRRELSLMKGLAHPHVLAMDAVYVDLVEDSLWIRMELMERSLADVIALVPHGLMLQQDRLFARFASDILLALEFLQQHQIAHRDVRSDNLLLNNQGLLKLADFSTAVLVPTSSPMCSESVGVLYWQAPEIRSPPYDALQVDVWSLGATVWEMAEAEPPFAESQQVSDCWPPLRQPELFSPAFHDFLRQCSLPASSRPKPIDLKKSLFINNACGRAVVIQILSQCMAMEQQLQFASQ